MNTPAGENRAPVLTSRLIRADLPRNLFLALFPALRLRNKDIVIGPHLPLRPLSPVIECGATSTTPLKET